MNPCLSSLSCALCRFARQDAVMQSCQVWCVDGDRRETGAGAGTDAGDDAEADMDASPDASDDDDDDGDAGAVRSALGCCQRLRDVKCRLFAY